MTPQIIIKTPILKVDELSDFQTDAMCRTIIGSIRRLFEDERNRTDFEQWKKARAKEQPQ